MTPHDRSAPVGPPSRRSPAVSLALWPVVLGGFLAGCGGSEPEPAISGPRELRHVRTVVRPDLTERTRWLGRSRELSYDSATGHLLGINADRRFAFEIDLEGNLVGRYGRPGGGPGELRNPLDLLLTPAAVLVHDRGNMKLARFSRSGGPPEEWRISWGYTALARDGKEFLAIPGRDTVAVEVLGDGAVLSGGFGARSLLPNRCVGCLLVPTAEDIVALVEPVSPELVLLARDGTVRRRLDLSRLGFMERWREEEAEILGQVTFRGGKVWVSDVESRGGTLFLAVIPPRPWERGRELWRVELDPPRITRYRYDRPDVGNDIALAWPRLFTVGVRDGAIHEYRLPGGEASRSDEGP